MDTAYHTHPCPFPAVPGLHMSFSVCFHSTAAVTRASPSTPGRVDTVHLRALPAGACVGWGSHAMPCSVSCSRVTCTRRTSSHTSRPVPCLVTETLSPQRGAPPQSSEPQLLSSQCPDCQIPEPWLLWPGAAMPSEQSGLHELCSSFASCCSTSLLALPLGPE